MKINDYQQLAKRTMPLFEELEEVVPNYAMGLSGESGEVVDLLKKHIYHGHELDREELIKELGDTLHYLTGIATLFEIDLEEIAQTNIEKLKKRYPRGFNQQDSINRTI